MPRTKKFRNVCCMPESTLFCACDNQDKNAPVITISVEEYEAIRLIDMEGLTQEECAVQMSVARTTVQRIYNIARTKIAEYLVTGAFLKIDGGSYKLCDIDTEGPCGPYCRRGHQGPPNNHAGHGRNQQGHGRNHQG